MDSRASSISADVRFQAENMFALMAEPPRELLPVELIRNERYYLFSALCRPRIWWDASASKLTLSGRRWTRCASYCVQGVERRRPGTSTVALHPQRWKRVCLRSGWFLTTNPRWNPRRPLWQSSRLPPAQLRTDRSAGSPRPRRGRPVHRRRAISRRPDSLRLRRNANGRAHAVRSAPRRSRRDAFYLASRDGEPVGAARALLLRFGVNLSGGAVAPKARSQGVYRP